MSIRFRGLAALLFAFLLLMPSLTVNAAGPPQPPNIFQPPATPTPAFLPPATVTPSPTPAPRPEDIPAPGDGGTTIFLPFLSAQGPSLITEEAGDDESNPMVDSFVYVVKPGDALNDLAMEFGRDAKTMSCVRTEGGDEVRGLMPGQRIVIPALSDLCHVVKSGQTLDKIAAWYGVTPESLIAVPENHLTADAALHRGQTILIPNARSRYHDPAELNLARPQQDGWWYGDGDFIWPLPRDSFWISQRFRHGKHMAVDLAAPRGTPVYAADTGRVVKAGWSEIGYGYRIIIDHGIDYVTLYAHLSEYYVQPGDIVQKGEMIGRVGSTGNSTGPHLHFEIRDYGYLIDPLLVLPK